MDIDKSITANITKDEGEKNIHNFKRSELIKFIGYAEYDLVNILTKIIEYNK